MKNNLDERPELVYYIIGTMFGFGIFGFGLGGTIKDACLGAGIGFSAWFILLLIGLGSK